MKEKIEELVALGMSFKQAYMFCYDVTQIAWEVKEYVGEKDGEYLYSTPIFGELVYGEDYFEHDFFDETKYEKPLFKIGDEVKHNKYADMAGKVTHYFINDNDKIIVYIDQRYSDYQENFVLA